VSTIPAAAQLGGVGDGTKSLLESLKGKLPGEIERKIRDIARFRNQAAHEQGFVESLQQVSLDRFFEDAAKLKSWLDSQLATLAAASEPPASKVKRYPDHRELLAELSKGPELIGEDKNQVCVWASDTPRKASSIEAVSYGVAAAALLVLGIGAYKLGLIDKWMD
jgi:hypothetical protein